MTDERLAELAEAAGFILDWVDADNQPQRVSPEIQRDLLIALGYPANTVPQINESLSQLKNEQQEIGLGETILADQGNSLSLAGHFKARTPFIVQCENGEKIEARLDNDARLPAIDNCGYHELVIGDQRLSLAVAPPACQSVQELTNQQQIWGFSAQLYSLRRPDDGGAGDTEALELLVRSAATKGADAVAVSPVHAMFSANPESYSPYSPSSRLLFNILYATPGPVLGEAAVAAAMDTCDVQEELTRLEAQTLIDWPAVTKVRQQLLRAMWAEFYKANDQRKEDFEHFKHEKGYALLQHCRFEALHSYMLSHGQPGNWQKWPEKYQDPADKAMLHFAAEHSNEIDYHAFCQWLIARGLARVQDVARDNGMRIGLIADLAVGADRGGSQTWSRQGEFLHSLSVGAPPDIINRSGQNWGLSAFSPNGLKRFGYRAFIDMLQANLAYAGGLRIDHVMGLKRIWTIPDGQSAECGAYLRYPFTDMLRLLSLESQRHRALIIGEDLGTVAEGLRETLAQRKILGMRVLLFEKTDGRFNPPDTWPTDALATTTTHDLPTISGWLAERDIDWRQRVGQASEEQTAADRATRQQEMASLTDALVESGQLEHKSDNPTQKLEACVGFIASTRAPLVLLPLEDALGETEQPNLPGIGTEHPNWRRRWPTPADQMLNTPQVYTCLQRLKQGLYNKRDSVHE